MSRNTGLNLKNIHLSLKLCGNHYVYVFFWGEKESNNFEHYCRGQMNEIKFPALMLNTKSVVTNQYLSFLWHFLTCNFDFQIAF